MFIGFFMSGVKSLFRFGLMLILLTVIGQVTYGEDSLENRYHEWVNSSEFQRNFWVVMTPVTWTTEKIQELWAQNRPSSPLSSR